jgi:hypothetical protein
MIDHRKKCARQAFYPCKLPTSDFWHLMDIAEHSTEGDIDRQNEAVVF